VKRSEVEAKTRKKKNTKPKIKSDPLANWTTLAPPQALTRDVKSTTTCRTWIWVGWPPPPQAPPLPPHRSPWTFGPSIFYKHPNWRCRSFLFMITKTWGSKPFDMLLWYDTELMNILEYEKN
jgi:hypothetical protein